MNLPIAEPVPQEETKTSSLFPILRTATITAAHFTIDQVARTKEGIKSSARQIGQGAHSIAQSLGIRLRSCLLNIADHLPAHDNIQPPAANIYFVEEPVELEF